MRRIDPDVAKWTLAQCRRQGLAAVRKAGSEKAKALLKKRQKRSGTRQVNGQLAVLSMPELIGAIQPNQRKEMVRVIQSARQALLEGKRVRLDFSRTRLIRPGGMLLLIAFLEGALHEYAGRLKVRCLKGSLAGQLLHHTGFGKRLGMAADHCRPEHESVLTWQFVSGTHAEGDKVDALITAFRSLAEVTISDSLYDVVTEALTNVVHHAYRDKEEHGPPRRTDKWWIFASLTLPKGGDRGGLYLAVYDRGIGIQGSMRRRLNRREVVLDHSDPILRLLGMRNVATRKLDQLLLARAVEKNDSSTGLGFRGKGLPEMRAFAKEQHDSALYILSGSAQYSYRHAGQKVELTSAVEHVVLGTMVIFQIPLHADQESQP